MPEKARMIAFSIGLKASPISRLARFCAIREMALAKVSQVNSPDFSASLIGPTTSCASP